ncbi:MAG: class C sortase [Ruminococcaceae bacterium]|nr:class C sortase [Oscillospiraceae bacterium]
MKKKNKWSTFVLLSIFFVGLSVMLYPAISSYWNSRTVSQAIVDYEKMLENIPKEDYTKFFDEAEEYNKSLGDLENPLLDYKSLENYMEVLDLSGTGMIGYLSIEKIALELPVYHTTNDEVLSFAAGHLEGTSFPVGGEGTHAVVSAHRGLPTAVLFTHLDRMELGDTFKFTILDRTITYRVDQIKTIDPSNAADLVIEDGKEYCTLLTCTPYGINTHRLFVRGVRIESVEESNVYVISDAHKIDSLIVTPIVALPILFTLMMIVLFKPVKKDDLAEEF